MIKYRYYFLKDCWNHKVYGVFNFKEYVYFNELQHDINCILSNFEDGKLFPEEILDDVLEALSKKYEFEFVCFDGIKDVEI